MTAWSLKDAKDVMLQVELRTQAAGAIQSCLAVHCGAEESPAGVEREGGNKGC